METMHKAREPKQTALWKKVVIIFLVVAMPLLFSFARTTRLQQTVNNDMQKPVPQPEKR